jgi:hypothetical protein
LFLEEYSGRLKDGGNFNLRTGIRDSLKGITQIEVHENSALRGIFAPKSEEVTGGSRKLHNKE